jgi:branched-chain amino acid transport system ATP-binding protein
MSAGPTLEVRGLDAGYGDLQILTDVELHVDPGEYVTIVGPNGAGKSTVMKSIVGLTTVMGGSIHLGETDLAPLPTEQTVHHGVGYVPQTANIFTGLSVQENLEMGAYILEEIPAERMAAIFERFPILEERRSQRAGQLSGGQRQMLAMGRALMLDPAILLLDEPSAGLAPDLVTDMFGGADGRAEREGGAAAVRPGLRARRRAEPLHGHGGGAAGGRVGQTGVPRRLKKERRVWRGAYAPKSIVEEVSTPSAVKLKIS